MVTRTLVNTGDPLVDPGGDPIANVVFSFQLVDAVKRQTITLFDAAEDGGEIIRGDVETATTNEVGLFTIDLWPNDRGDGATLYKVTLTGVVKPFYIRVTSGEGSLLLIEAKAAAEALQPQTLSLFEALLASITAQVAAFSEVVTTTVNGLMSYLDKVKLDGIATGANNYTHPANHGAAIITQDADNRFVTDTEKTTWNAKQSEIYDDSHNVKIGLGAFQLEGFSSYSIAIGDYALQNHPFSVDNIAIGKHVMKVSEGGYYNVAIGNNALESCTGGMNNACVGFNSLHACTEGTDNAMCGSNAGLAITSGNNNTGVGSGSLVQCTTGDSNTALGFSALSALVNYSNCTGVGHDSAVTGGNQIQLGTIAETTYAYGAVQNRSDARDKADVADTPLGLDFITRLRPVEFKWDYREAYFDKVDGVRVPVPKDGSRKRSRLHQGFIAQEVKQATTELGVDFGGYQNHSVNGGQDVLTLGYEEFIAPMVKAIQELNAEIQLLKNGGN
jgi:hypothetical protein